MANHLNRSMKKATYRNPAPEHIIITREKAGLSQEKAAKIIYSSLRTWQHWEAGESRMHPGLWELFKIKIEGK